MEILRWSDRDLMIMKERGYKVCPCKDAEEVEAVYEVLKANKRCAQVGYRLSKDNQSMFFVLTKERTTGGVRSGK